MASSRKLFSRLPRRQRNASRLLARDLLFELHVPGQPFDFQRARELADLRVRSVVGSLFVTIAVQLIIALIKYWLENRVTEPAAIYEIGEPGNYEMGEAEDAN